MCPLALCKIEGSEKASRQPEIEPRTSGLCSHIWRTVRAGYSQSHSQGLI